MLMMAHPVDHFIRHFGSSILWLIHGTMQQCRRKIWFNATRNDFSSNASIYAQARTSGIPCVRSKSMWKIAWKVFMWKRKAMHLDKCTLHHQVIGIAYDTPWWQAWKQNIQKLILQVNQYARIRRRAVCVTPSCIERKQSAWANERARSTNNTNKITDYFELYSLWTAILTTKSWRSGFKRRKKKTTTGEYEWTAAENCISVAGYAVVPTDAKSWRLQFDLNKQIKLN